ncbi:MAG: flippase [Candidatus Thiodiazotropha sp. (ex Troendleina suluensis)]|nr:flippase [Candidatus Thiodiazotropha sp. (ex Troendleina suluensis)]
MKKYYSNLLNKKATANASWLVVEKLITMMLVLIASVLIARHLGPDDYGRLSYLISIVALLAPFSTLGLNGIVIKEFVVKSDKQDMVLSTSLIMRLIGGSISCVALFFVVWLGEIQHLEDYIWGLALLSFVNIFTAFHVIDCWFQSIVSSKYIVWTRLSVLLLMFTVKVILVVLDKGLTSFIIAVAIESLLISLGFALLYYGFVTKIKIFEAKFNYGLKLLKQSRWLIFSGFASIINLKIDQVMLGTLVSVEEVGIYSVASKLSEVWYFFPVALVTSFFPSLLNKKKTSESQYESSLQRLCDVLFLSAFVVAILVTFFGEFIISILFGSDYLASIPILIIHIWASIFVFMRALLSKWLIAEEILHFSLLSHGIGAVVNVVLNLILIPVYMGIGAATASVVSYAVASYFCLFLYPKTRVMAKIMTKSIILPVRLNGYLRGVR